MISHDQDSCLEDAFVTRSLQVAIVISDTNPCVARYDRLMTVITGLVLSGQLRGADAERWIARAERMRDAARDGSDHPILPIGT
jgi:hypothetical protein